MIPAMSPDMSPERWRRIEALFDAVVDRPAAERDTYLTKVCEGDEELRREVESLLAYENQTAGFIRNPAMEVVARELADESVLSTRTIDHFQILSLLGRGGMGEVYLALWDPIRGDARFKDLLRRMGIPQ